MTNNDIMRRIRYIFDFNDTKMMELCSSSNQPATREQISDWLKKEDDPAYQECPDRQLAIFLNGLIVANRGRREGPQPEPEENLTNNMVLMKLKIALNLKAEELLQIFSMAHVNISKHELSAFFRRPDHKHYRACQDQLLRNFLKGAQVKYRKD